jgi:hypothetical protein
MTAIFLALAGLWLFAGLIKLARPRKPTLFRHQLSDKASGMNYFTCDSVILGLMLMSYFGRVAERCCRAS